jgi:hypothetical protein
MMHSGRLNPLEQAHSFYHFHPMFGQEICQGIQGSTSATNAQTSLTECQIKSSTFHLFMVE